MEIQGSTLPKKVWTYNFLYGGGHDLSRTGHYKDKNKMQIKKKRLIEMEVWFDERIKTYYTIVYHFFHFTNEKLMLLLMI